MEKWCWRAGVVIAGAGFIVAGLDQWGIASPISRGLNLLLTVAVIVGVMVADRRLVAIEQQHAKQAKS